MELLEQLQALVDGQQYTITVLSNASALLNEYLSDINWVGFYLYRDNRLILGPFQGKPACEIITLDRGVCGHAATIRQTVVVEDVHQFPGHIACDSASQSEIVIPLIIRNELFGLLDIDSPFINRFSKDDQIMLEKCVEIIQQQISIINENC